MTTEQIVQSEIDSFMDCFYGYLIKDGYWEKMPQPLKALFDGISPKDIAFILDGEEERYVADYTYFVSEQYGDEVCWAIPYGEIEIPKDEVPDAEQDDWIINGDYAYQTLPAISIYYNLAKVQQAITDWEQ